MNSNVETLAREITSLPADDKVFLLDRLLQSLADDKPDLKIEQLWMEEADRRWDEIVSGKAKPIPGDEAMRQAYAALRK